MLIPSKDTNLCKKPFDNLDQSTLIVTINRRLANFLRQQFDSQQQLIGKQVWQSADILPLETWLERCWNESWNEKILLNDFQAQLLWERIIGESEFNSELLRLDRTAQSAQQAWQLLQQWLLTLNDIKNDFNYDIQVFVKWVKDFIKICHNEGFIIHTDLPQLLLEQFKKSNNLLPKKIIFAGFEQLPPQLVQFIANLEKLGVMVEFLENTTPVSLQKVIALPNQQQELYSMARWAQQRLAENSSCTVACIVPNLQAIRDQVERIFTEVFTPFPFLPTLSENLPFNISIGKPLGDYPLIQHTLQILKLGQSELCPTATISRWLRSPFLAGAETEMSARALLDKELHELGEMETSLRSVMSLAQKSQSSYHCPILAKHLQKFLDNVKKLSGNQFPSEWATLFLQLLSAMKWPGQRAVNSIEFQTLQRWEGILTEFSSLDLVLGKITYSSAVNTLQQLAYSIIFQPQTPLAPVQILGVLEATGLHFDFMWVIGMDDESWPPHNQPNPFIPIKIQQQNNMPHASLPIAWQFYQKLLTLLLHCSHEIIFSYALQAEDRTLNINPLVKAMPQLTAIDLGLTKYDNLDHLIYSARDLESLEDWQAPIVKITETVKGGSNILKDQAGCPFRAFAKFRLHADTLKMPVTGLDYPERGSLIHSALEHIWNNIHDKQQLESYSDEGLENIVANAVAHTLLQYIPKKPLTLKKIFTQIEQIRLKKILFNWLNYEKRRLPFKVLAKEQSQLIKIGNMELTTRIDRIDQLADGTHIIIDYKTNVTSLLDWFGERIEEPQLPLYCISSDKPVSGIAFAQLHPRKMRFNGTAINADDLPDLTAIIKLPIEINKDWTSLLNEWRINLIKISNDFLAGNAKVDPKDVNKTCLYCDFKPLCRIYEKTHCRVD